MLFLLVEHLAPILVNLRLGKALPDLVRPIEIHFGDRHEVEAGMFAQLASGRPRPCRWRRNWRGSTYRSEKPRAARGVTNGAAMAEAPSCLRKDLRLTSVGVCVMLKS